MKNALFAAVALAMAASPAVAAQGDAFMKKAIEGNYAEIKMGELAQANGKNQAVKDFGQMLVKDHGDANTKALSVAAELKMTAPSGPNAKQQKLHDVLAARKGTAFDKVFMRRMMKEHERAIKSYTRASAAKDAAVAKYAAETLPTLKKHHQAAEQAAETVSN